jgi:hypothetical protein
MMDIEFTKQKLALLLKHLNELRSLLEISLDEYKKNFERRYAVGGTECNSTAVYKWDRTGCANNPCR